MASHTMVSERATHNNPPPAAKSAEPSVREIIASARSAPAPARGAWLTAGISSLMLWASFTPLDWGPLGWVCLAPLMLLIRPQRPTRWMYRAVFTCGLAGSLVTLQWMRLGDVWMYPAWLALAFYMALYFPVFVLLSRTAVHRFSMPLILAAPAVWVGLEFVRGRLMTGFAWYYLGHTQHNWIELIQICDVVGVYGVSFLLAMSSACLAGSLPTSVLARLWLLPAGIGAEAEQMRESTRKRLIPAICFLAVFAAVLSYGFMRRSQAEFRDGPRVALIQGNFPTSMKHDPLRAAEIFRYHDSLTGIAVKHQPDVVVWPETMFRWPLHAVSPDVSEQQLQALRPNVPDLNEKDWSDSWRKSATTQVLADMSSKAGAAMIIGIDTLSAAPEKLERYNSAVFVRPDTGVRGRYDKMHRVVFGEYVPLKKELPWLHRITPFAEGYGIDAGKQAAVFEFKGWRMAPVICFEDTVPHLVRNIVRATAEADKQGRPVDCLVNLTNDGWFHGSSELDQHLITAAFRCIECRTPMVRAVNTGVSAVIDGDGVVVEPDVFVEPEFLLAENRAPYTSMRDPKTGRWHKELNLAIIDTVPLDNRQSLYVAYGDWFSGGCCFATMLIVFGACIPRRRQS